MNDPAITSRMNDKEKLVFRQRSPTRAGGTTVVRGEATEHVPRSRLLRTRNCW